MAYEASKARGAAAPRRTEQMSYTAATALNRCGSSFGMELLDLGRHFSRLNFFAVVVAGTGERCVLIHRHLTNWDMLLNAAIARLQFACITGLVRKAGGALLHGFL